jgi:alpha-amylase/alpha-mannosidase (GH57 family)
MLSGVLAWQREKRCPARGGDFMMIKQKAAATVTELKTGQVYLCLHGHFYQPPRENPFTGLLPLEQEAAPFVNFNEKITSECYRPNAEAGNFAAISYDFGPTLAGWLERQHPDVHRRIVDAERLHRQRYGVGNAMAQVYNHPILPLASARDKRTQIVWGLQDFRHRYGHDAHGMWLAETAVDLESLDLLAQHGITYTILAPWQAVGEIDPSEPYIVPLRNGRSITVFFYNSPLSGGVSFNWQITNNATVFASSYLQEQIVKRKQQNGEDQLILVATDGELYGHHQPWRDKFLSYLISHGAPEQDIELCSLERYLQLHPTTKEAQIREPSAWSCSHGVDRWSKGCGCTEGDSSWKPLLRQALNNLYERSNELFEQYASKVLDDPWAARDDYLSLHHGWETPEAFWARHGKKHGVPDDAQLAQNAIKLLEAQYYHQYSFTSCGFYFEDLARIEPRNAIAFARRAISLVWQALGIDLQNDFVHDLQAAKSWRYPDVNGSSIYRDLPVVPLGPLPPAA